MHKRWRWLVGWMAGIAIIVTACAQGQITDQTAPAEAQRTDKEQPHDITLTIDGGTFIPDVTRSLHYDYMAGLTARHALESSGIVRFTEDQSAIQSVGEVSLDSTLEWGTQLNDKELDPSDWDHELKIGDKLLVYVKTVDSFEAIPQQASLLLIIDGGSPKKKYYVNKYDDNTTVRDLLKRSGIVQFSPTNKSIVSVGGYTPQENEQWILKVNGKKLLDTGLDMRLKPQDNVEIVLKQK
ncbi:hypothetical protein IM700_008235 [Paenibacillus sp. DXFW5]|uniref:Uncharacterized protein n=1 Tax=Paenibacillus rhizolycopersici TaxID=2780073 RepID=A0ABS2H2I8_9BACL|nr:hypothetical protein [Paenibacillus rhizolycopersici]MBM6995652.1 hypothetical protein [Paenibacillus rhizolycopersici]